MTRARRLGVVVVALLAGGSGACSLNQRLVAARAPYGINDLVFVPDRKLELTSCDQADAQGQRYLWARLNLVFVPGGQVLREVGYRLVELGEGGEPHEVTFAYELHQLSQPQPADVELTKVDKPVADEAITTPPNPSPSREQRELQNKQQQMIQQVTTLDRPEKTRQEWRCAVSGDAHLLSFDKNRLLGSHTVALVAAADGGFHTGGTYRLSFTLPRGTRRAADASALAPPTTSEEIGGVQLNLVKNSNLIGVPLGILLIVGFLVLTTAL